MLLIRLVAGAGTVSKLGDTGPFVRPAPVVVRMAGRAIRLEDGGWPRDGLRVTGMAIVADQVDPVVARIGCRLVREDEWIPEVPAVAEIALELGHEVTVAFAGGRGAIVAARTSSWHDVAVVEARWNPGRCRVADITLGGGL